jgi:hypothetical protein
MYLEVVEYQEDFPARVTHQGIKKLDEPRCVHRSVYDH